MSQGSKTYIGFWIYLMTDVVLFASLFAAYAVLHNNTAGGPALGHHFNLQYVLTQTVILLASSYTCALGVWAARTGRRRLIGVWFGLTAILGAAFLAMEMHEFNQLVEDGYSWMSSAALSSFFGLVGTHGAHITFGLIWMAALVVWVLRRPLDDLAVGRLTLLSLFWHFLDVIWIFIFSLVYLAGVGLA